MAYQDTLPLLSTLLEPVTDLTNTCARCGIHGFDLIVSTPFRIPVTRLTVKLGLAAVCAYIGSLLAFPGLRLAQTHLDAVQMNSDRPLIQ